METNSAVIHELCTLFSLYSISLLPYHFTLFVPLSFPFSVHSMSDVVAYSTEERLTREALYGAAAAPPLPEQHDVTTSSDGLPPLVHPEPNALTNARTQHTIALAAAGPLPPLPGHRHAPPHRPGIDDGVLSTLCGRAQARLVLSGMEQATALWAQHDITGRISPSKAQPHQSPSKKGARGQSTGAAGAGAAVAAATTTSSAIASSGNPLTGWSSGCPQASIRIVTHYGSGGGSGNNATWRRRHEGAFVRATKLVATTSVIRDNAVEESHPSQGGKGPYGVSLLCFGGSENLVYFLFLYSSTSVHIECTGAICEGAERVVRRGRETSSPLLPHCMDEDCSTFCLFLRDGFFTLHFHIYSPLSPSHEQVVWLEGLREFRRTTGPGSLPVDRFRPKPPAPHRA